MKIREREHESKIFVSHPTYTIIIVTKLQSISQCSPNFASLYSIHHSLNSVPVDAQTISYDKLWLLKKLQLHQNIHVKYFITYPT